jgi:hypothetical protein
MERAMSRGQISQRAYVRGDLAKRLGQSFPVWISLCIPLLFIASSGYATKFANQFIEFELPPQWQCNLEGAEWVCQSQSEGKKRDTIMVFAAKQAGPLDSVDQYLAYLKTSKIFTVNNKSLRSEVKYAKTITINSQSWVDAIHFESEIPGFYTRYLSTVKQDIGILVTFSVNKTKYSQYLSDFETMQKSLKVFRKEGGITAAQTAKVFQDTQIPTSIGNDSVFSSVMPSRSGVPEQPVQPKTKKGKIPSAVLLGIVAAIVFLLILKRRRED